MAFDLASISNEKRLRAPRIILLGVEKIGKSCFAAKSDRAIFIPIKGEEGIDDIEVAKFPTCMQYGDLLQCFYTLYTSQHNYGTVVIDSASAAEPMIWTETCRENGNASSIEQVNGGYGKGYVEAMKYWWEIAHILDSLRNERNMASIIIGHVKVKRFDDPAGPSYDQYQWDINEKAALMLYKWADAILFANTKVVVNTEKVGFNKEKGKARDITGGARYLFTQKRPAHPGGGRGPYGELPYELPLNWGNFMDAVAAASGQKHNI
jgi:hypothetical protein